MSETAPFADAFESRPGVQRMRDVLGRRCAEQTVEIAALREEVGAVRRRLAEIVAAYTQASRQYGVPLMLGDAIKRPAP